MKTRSSNEWSKIMKSILTVSPRRVLPTAFALSLVLSGIGIALGQNTNLYIQSLSGNGVLTWSNCPGMVAYKVQWAPTAAGPWNDSWDCLAKIPATGTLYKAAVPMFYRLAAIGVTNVLLLHGDGPDGAATIRDEAGHALVRYGDTHLSTNQSKFGGTSIFFDGSGDYLTSPISPDWWFGTNDFTVDLWVNFTSSDYTISLIGQHTGGVYSEWSIVYDHGQLQFIVSGLPALSVTWSPELGLWYHVAATRASGILRLFVNGTVLATVPCATDIPANRVLAIGAADNPAYYLNGYMDEIRINKGVSAWTNNFTPPSSPYNY